MSGTDPTVNNADLQRLASELSLSAAAWRRAVEIAGTAPGRPGWRRSIDVFLLAAGVLLIVVGIAAFFAWNWADLGRAAKFALIQGGVVVAVLLAWWRGLDSMPGRAALLAGAALVGVLLAYFGQTYQTGADPYGLFFGWALLILPWALIGRQAGLWILLLLLANLTLILYWTQVLDPPGGLWQLSALLGPLVGLGMMAMNSELSSWLFAINALALIAWELLAIGTGATWMQGRWFPRLAATAALGTVVAPTLAIIFVASFGETLKLSMLSPALYAVATAACLVYYRRRRLDLFILTCCLTGAILVVTSLAIRIMLESIGSMLLLSLLLIGQVAAASWWLRDVAQKAERPR